MRRIDPGLWARLIPLALVIALLASSAGAQQGGPDDPLAAMRFDIIGAELVVEPPVLTVPKNIPTELHAELRAAGSDDPVLAEALSELAEGAEVVAELRGPSLPTIPIRVRAGDPIPVPPLALPGDYFIDQIRLEKDGEVLLEARPSSVAIKVISEVMVTSVSSRPLSLEEIREKGIVIDEHSFQAFEFQLALDFDSEELRIELPVVLPNPERESFTEPEQIELAALNQALAQTALTQLPEAFDRPGLNFELAAVPFVQAGDSGSLEPFELPPITGLVVIPSNIAFLNQFFSVLLMVGNVAPDGTPLVLTDVEGEISLPLGPDHVAGSLEVPGDDPLRLARIEGIGVQPVVPVTLPGADGELGTADDLPEILPGEQGSGEFLVEGLREGAHTVEIEIDATLEGLPSGPVELTGVALGSVFVRNPTYSVTLSHPRTVRSGEPYDLYATITNTSESVANLASMNLSPRSISGAVLVSEPSVQFESIAPRESVTARFRLIAQQTGEVRFSAFNTESGVSGRFELRTGIGERGIALSPNAIVLPETVSALPDELVATAQRVLGQAFSIATAPAGGLPADVLFVRRLTVFERGRDLGAAGQRLEFGEPLERVIWDLLLDWTGRDREDEGFDQLLRQTDAGASFMAEVAAILRDELAGTSLLDLQRDFAGTTVSRAPHLSAIVGAGSSGAPVRMRIIGRSGAAVGADAEGEVKSLADAALLALADGAGRADMIVLSRLGDAPYTLEVVAEEATVFDLGLTLPGEADELLQLRYPAIPLQAGGVARAILGLDGTAVSLEVDEQGDGSVDSNVAPIEERIVEGPPQVITLRQLAATTGHPLDPALHGLLIGVLFDKPVDAESAEAPGSYAVEENAVIAGVLQPRERLVFLYLEKPIGALVEREITVQDVRDEDGRALIETTLPIEMQLWDGARVMGQVRTAQGDPVAGTVLELKVKAFAGGELESMVVSRVLTLGDGSFEFDFVSRQTASFQLTAQHPVSGLFAIQYARVSAPGQILLLNLTFRGAGTVRGHVYRDDGVTPAANAQVSLFPEVLTAQLFFTNANELGEYVFSDVPVGLYSIQARSQAGGWGQASGVLQSAGEEAVTDIDLLVAPDLIGQLEGRVFAGDGSTPAAGVSVYVGTFNRDSLGISAVAQGETDVDGYFSFDHIPPPPEDVPRWEVIAVDLATTQIGVTNYIFVPAAQASVNVRLEGAGVVEGLVLDAQQQRVEGAVVAGGLELVYTDADGFFRIENVPGGTRILEAGDPATRRQGQTSVTVVPGQTVNASITLSGRASIVGQVLDENGDPVPGVSVRIPTERNGASGYYYVIADGEGNFEFPYLELGSYLLQAPGPEASALIDGARQAGIDPRLAYTRGDLPEDLENEPTPINSQNPLLAASGARAQSFVAGGLESGPPGGGFGWAKVDLQQDGDVRVADIRYLPQGSVSGATTTAAGAGIGAMVRVMGLSVTAHGGPTTSELGRMETDPATGAFFFDGIPVFDLQAFLDSGVPSGNFSLEALSPFYPVILTHAGQLDTNEPHASGIQLAFPDSQETNGTITGTVFLPDGVTPAPEHTLVRISYGDLTVQTDADGRFETILEIPAGSYRLEAEEPGGLRGEALVEVPAGGNIDATIRLLGLGAVTADVVREDGSPVAGAIVSLKRGSFPFDEADGAADATGRIRFVNISEGPFSIGAMEPITGLGGRASGEAVPDGEVAVTAVITSSGRVTGIFLAVDGVTPIANAQVELRAGAIHAYATTDATGRFEIDLVPAQVPLSVSALDPLTGRSGSARGEIPSQGAVIELTLIQGPRGTVAGMVLRADGVMPVPGSTAKLDISGRVPVQVSAGADGSFRFEGVPAGHFDVSARDPLSGFWGSTFGQLSFEGEVVRADVVLAGWGSIEGTVLDAGGSPADNAFVEIVASGQTQRANVGVDAEGRFRADYLALRSYDVRAYSIANEYDWGVRRGVVLDRPDQVAEVTVELGGVGDAEVLVVDSDGVTPVSGVSLVLNHTRGQFFAFTNSSGLATIQGIPPGPFDVQAEIGPLGGVASGNISAPGELASVTIQLGPSAAIQGNVLLSDGMTAAVDALVTLEFHDQGGGERTLQLRSDVLGEFLFTGIPLGPFSLRVFEPVSRGVASTAGTLDVVGETLDVGSLILDSESPVVLTVTPGDGAADAPVDAPIAVEFSEAMQAQSFIFSGPSQNVALSAAGSPVPFDGGLSSDGALLTLTPSAPLASDVLHTLSIRGRPDGPMDEADLTLVLPFVSSFTTEDNVPPTLVSASPAASAVEVSPEAVVRLTFSEAVDSALELELETSAGAPVAGQLDLTLAGSVAIFTPGDFLDANENYTVHLRSVQDRAGNPLLGGDTSFGFATVDTLAPVLAALDLQGAPLLIGGGSVSLLPELPDGDAARVEYEVTGIGAHVAAAAPFGLDLALPVEGGELAVLAVAVDDVGNRSIPLHRNIPVAPNQPPTASLESLSGSGSVGAGQELSFSVSAADDLALQQVVFSTSGALSSSVVEPVLGQSALYQSEFQITVPADAAADSVLTVQAAAIDSVGKTSPPALLTFSLEDAVRPSVAINAPPAGARVISGSSVDVVVEASDDVELASVELACAPALVGCEPHPLPAGTTSALEHFSVEIPASMVAPAALGLVATASDSAGNTRTVVRSLEVADDVAPELLTLILEGEAAQLIPGQSVTVSAQASDNVGVTQIELRASGAFAGTHTVPITPPATSASAQYSFTIPESAAPGSTISIAADARDASANTSAEANLVLTIASDEEPPVVSLLAPDEGVEVGLLTSLTVTALVTDDTAVARVVLDLSGALAGTAAGGASSVERVIDPALPSSEVSFQLDLDASTSVGVGQISVTAFDTSGNPSVAATRSVTVIDTLAPTLSITSPSAGAELDPSGPISVRVEAQDNQGVAEIQLTASGGHPFDETRVMLPPAASAMETFQITYDALPKTGDQLTLLASARDAANNSASSAPVSISVRDLVPPEVVTFSPASGSEDVALDVAIRVEFDEPMDAATITAGSVSLLADGAPLGIAPAFLTGGQILLMNAVGPLPSGALITARIESSLTDAAGNPLGAALEWSFTTFSDEIGPQVVSTEPVDGATSQPLDRSIRVLFTKPVERSSVNAGSFAVSAAGETVTGSFDFDSGDARVTFTPEALLPVGSVVSFELGAGILDLSGNPLADAAGQPVSTPIHFEFTTAEFAIVRPFDGVPVREKTEIMLEAQSGSALALARVEFEVNGVSVGSVAAPPYQLSYTTPAMSEAASLEIRALAYDATDTLLAEDLVTVSVQAPLLIEPRLLGIPLGESRTLRLYLTSPPETDLMVVLSASDAAVIDHPASALIPAGESEALVEVTGLQVGCWPVDAGQPTAPCNATLIASSALGEAEAVISVSEVTAAPEFAPIGSAVGVRLHALPTAGRYAIPASAGVQHVELRVLASPNAVDTPVSLTSSDPLLVDVTPSAVVPAGQTSIVVTLTPTGVSGSATLTVDTGAVPFSVRLDLEDHPTNIGSPTSPAVGVNLMPPAVGQASLTLAPSTSQTVPVRLFALPVDTDTAVEVTSSDPDIVSVTSPLVIPAGETELLLPLVTGAGAPLASDRGNLLGTAAADAPHPTGRILGIDYDSASITGTLPGPAGYLIGDGWSGLASRPSSRTLYLVDGAGTNRIFELDAETGAVLNSFASPSGGMTLDGLAFLGDELYGLQAGSGFLWRIDPDTGVGASFGISVGGTIPGGLAGAAGRLFSRGAVNTTIVERSSINGDVIASFATPAGQVVTGLAFDGVDLFASAQNGTIYRLDPDSGAVRDSNDIGMVLDGLAITPGHGTYRGSASIELCTDERCFLIDLVLDSQPTGAVPPLAGAVGVRLVAPGSAGELLLAPGTSQAVRLRVLTVPLASDLPVTVTSSDPSVVSVGGALAVPAGETAALLTLATGGEGESQLLVEAGGQSFRLVVRVGSETPEQLLAPAVGVKLVEVPGGDGGGVVLPSGASQGLRLRLLSQPAASDTVVSVTSSDEAVAQVLGTVVIPAGEITAVMTLSGGAEGTAQLTLRVGESVIRIEVTVGTNDEAPRVAPAVGVEVMN